VKKGVENAKILPAGTSIRLTKWQDNESEKIAPQQITVFFRELLLLWRYKYGGHSYVYVAMIISFWLCFVCVWWIVVLFVVICLRYNFTTG